MKLKVFDLHCDTLDRLVLSADPSVPGGFYEHDEGVPRDRMSSLDDNDSHISLDRMAAFDWCQCFAVYVPDVLRGDNAWEIFTRVEAFWRSELSRLSDRLAQVQSGVEALQAFSEEKSAGILTVEGCSFLEDGDTAEQRLDAMMQAGVKMATLTWNGLNALGGGVEANSGLTSFGTRMVRAMEERGIVVDASHLNAAGLEDLLDVAEKPFACSHSNARAVCGHPRNLTDSQLRELAARGCIVGLNFYNGFLSPFGGEATPDDVLRHVERMLNIGGEGFLALGSDYDGSDVPQWLDPCTKVADLHALLVREFGEPIADNIFFNNAVDFFF